jgi:hypothetical protein
MLVVMVWNEGSAREEAAAAYAATVGVITDGAVGLRRKQGRSETRPLARGYETTVLAVGREHAVWNVAVPDVAQPRRDPQGAASQAQRHDARPIKWDAHEPAVLIQASSLQDVMERINQWRPTLPVIIIGHHSMNVTAVTHPNVMLYLCDDDSAECFVEGSEAAAVGAAWAQSDADLSGVIGVMLAPPSASRRFHTVALRGGSGRHECGRP